MSGPYSAWIGIFAFCLPGVAQQGAIQPAPPPAEADGRIILNVVANDKSGKPVAGLQQQDFTILDNKHPQKILSFQAIAEATRTGSGVQVVLVVDALNTWFTKMALVRGQIDRFLRQDGSRLAWPVSIGIFTDAGLDMQPNASRDGNALAAYLDQHETGLRTLPRSTGYYGAVERNERSIWALEQLADKEANRPGRKLVIWISPGWPLLSATDLGAKDEKTIFHTIVALSTRLRNAGITLYAVNPLGSLEPVGRTFSYQQFLKPVTAPTRARIGDLGLQVLASHTGGRVLKSSDVASQIEKCVRDANAYYVLSFAPPPAVGPNYYNAIEVKIAQHGLKAQTRSGFYGQPVASRTP
ncbi:MAG TPA: VWA domain-containing protein [Bryobacteraceae bacterium]